MVLGKRQSERVDPRAAGDAALAAEIDVVERVRARYPRPTRLNFGAPTRCPRCGGFGLVDAVDVVTGRSVHRCRPCEHEWVITVRALLAVDGRPASPSRGPRDWLAELTRRRTAADDLAPDPDQAGVRFTRTADGQVQRLPVSEATAPLPPPPTGEDASRPVAPVLPLRVLLVEDDPAHVETVRSLVDPAGPVIDLRTATTRAAAEVAARVSEPDLVLLDLGLPDSTGEETIEAWRRHRPVDGAPVLVLSDEEVEVDADLGPGVAGVVPRAALARLRDEGDAGRRAFLDLLTGSSAPPGTPRPRR